jgi:hypothetical protein
MRVCETKGAELRDLRDVPVKRRDDPTMAIEIKYVEDLLESQLRLKPVPLLRRPVAG